MVIFVGFAFVTIERVSTFPISFISLSKILPHRDMLNYRGANDP
jgi:hypothetical protein